MNKSKIEWTDYTWNPLTGCLRRCEYCYAWKLARGRLKSAYLNNKNIMEFSDINDSFSPRFWPERLKEPVKVKKSARIFVCSMGEIFSSSNYKWIQQILSIISDCPQHTFQILTQESWHYKDFNWPSNCWLGVTMTHPIGRFHIKQLSAIQAIIHFVSFEPLLENIGQYIDFNGIDWIIIGSQTQPLKLPDKEWVEYIIDKADEQNIPIFLKNNLKPLLGENLRQEFPSIDLTKLADNGDKN